MGVDVVNAVIVTLRPEPNSQRAAGYVLERIPGVLTIGFHRREQAATLGREGVRAVRSDFGPNISVPIFTEWLYSAIQIAGMSVKVESCPK